MPIKHVFQSTKPASEDPDVVGSAQWNSDHEVTGPRYLGGAMLFSNNWQINDTLATTEVNGVAVSKSAEGTFTIFAGGLGQGGVLVQTAPGFTCDLGSPYYDSLSIEFKNASDNAPADPTFFSVIAFGS